MSFTKSNQIYYSKVVKGAGNCSLNRGISLNQDLSVVLSMSETLIFYRLHHSRRTKIRSDTFTWQGNLQRN